MTTYRITYLRTGRTGTSSRDYSNVYINTGDERTDGSKVNNITDAIDFFEELAKNWGSYENRNAISKIETI